MTPERVAFRTAHTVVIVHILKISKVKKSSGGWALITDVPDLHTSVLDNQSQKLCRWVKRKCMYGTFNKQQHATVSLFWSSFPSLLTSISMMKYYRFPMIRHCSCLTAWVWLGRQGCRLRHRHKRWHFNVPMQHLIKPWQSMMTNKNRLHLQLRVSLTSP